MAGIRMMNLNALDLSLVKIQTRCSANAASVPPDAASD
jgi:hypothetical protein